MKIRRINLLQNYLFEHSSNPSLRKAIEEPNSEAANQRASQPTNPLFNVATIINHLGYLYFCISLWDSHHIQAIGAKFSSLSIYIYTRRRFYNAAGVAGCLSYTLVGIPRPPPLSPQRAACTWIFTNFERKHGGRQHHHPSLAPAPDVACQPTFIFAPVFDPPPLRSARSRGIAPVTRTCVVAQQDSSSSESESRWNVVFNFSRFRRFNFFSSFFLFWRRGFNLGKVSF